MFNSKATRQCGLRQSKIAKIVLILIASNYLLGFIVSSMLAFGKAAELYPPRFRSLQRVNVMFNAFPLCCCLASIGATVLVTRFSSRVVWATIVVVWLFNTYSLTVVLRRVRAPHVLLDSAEVLAVYLGLVVLSWQMIQLAKNVKSDRG